MTGRPTFRRRLFIIFIGSVTIPLLLVAVATSLVVNAGLQSRRYTDISNVLSPMAQQIDYNVKELDRIAFAPYLYQGMLDTMTYMNRGYLEHPQSGLVVTKAEQDYVAMMQRLQLTSKQRIRSVTFYPEASDPNIAYQIRPEAPGLVRVNEPAFQDCIWFKEARTTRRVFVGPWREGDDWVYSLAVAIQDLDRRQSIGVLRIEASAEVIISGLAESDLQTGDRILLVDASDQIRYDTTTPGHTGDVYDVGAVGNAHVTETLLGSAPWRLIYLAKDQTAWSTLVAVLIASSVALGTTLLAWALYRRELRSTLVDVSAITETLHQMEVGKLDAIAAVRSSDDLGRIADSVNHLGLELRGLIDREYRAVIAKQKAEYRALQAQLSPHFVHNVLNDMVALNRMGEREKLEASLVRVSRQLRYSCSTADTATVADEVAFAEQYLYLRQLQLEDRLVYTVDVTPEADRVEMPRLVVQPLVENSLKHGLGDQIATIHVNVRAVVQDDWLEVSVTDDGEGFEAEEIEAASGFATTSIRERLEILSPGSRLDIVSAPGAGTKCVVRLRVCDPSLESEHTRVGEA